METTLADFFRAYGDKSWAAATVNCLMFPAAWGIWLGHRDPIEKWRGVVRDEEHMRAIVTETGGCVPLVGEAAALIGGRRVSHPACGDVGVIGSATRIDRQFGAIFDGRRWQVRFIDRISPMMAQPLAIWRI
ncbi:hypothetical protein IB238_05670 [Rhizobium sp. ARZ01]|uniref:hypothetical protein n=1 Tax=Rhizobium sp. ARZ01 TaxID=2769313 RepID=UPI0017844DD9|nr:hypothetical protein [Rhizobium sp. ARZ01]MBD9372118.1 hypothetical protein [Rhizobium sp. ARZ01]